MMDIIVPQIGESIVEAEIGQWYKKNGELVNADDLLLELETEKVNVELNADISGTLSILAQAGETVKIGAVIGRIEAGETTTPSPTRDTRVSVPKAGKSKQTLPPMNPAVAKLAAERGIDLSTITGSGRNGRILVDDLPAPVMQGEGSGTDSQPLTIKSGPKEPSPSPPTPLDAKPVGPVSAERTRRVPMTQIRKKIAERLLMARQQTAMLTTFTEIDMSRVIHLRESHKESFLKKHGVPLGQSECRGVKRIARSQRQHRWQRYSLSRLL